MHSRGFFAGILLLSTVFFLTALSTGCSLNGGAGDFISAKKYDDATTAGVNDIIDRQMKDGGIPGALVGVWEEGYETLLIAKGLADVAVARPAQTADRFRIASNTKMFTAMALLMLADEKKITLDDKVSLYLPEIPHAGLVTIRQLANHTSGYYDYTEEPAFIAACTAANLLRSWKPAEMIAFINSRPLRFTPGTQYKYSNTNYTLMGMIIEKVGGTSWENFITQKIITPLALKDTSCPAGPYIPGNHLKGYNLENSTPVEIVVDPSFGWAAGGMISTLDDMKKWLDSLAAGSLISPKMYAEQRSALVTDPESTGLQYGFGLMVIRTRFIGHTGVIPGYNSGAFISSDGKKAVIVVFNDEEGFYGASTAFKIINFLFF